MLKLFQSKCIDSCTRNFINSNQRIMNVFVEVQSEMVQKKIKDMNSQTQNIQSPGIEEKESEKDVVLSSQSQ